MENETPEIGNEPVNEPHVVQEEENKKESEEKNEIAIEMEKLKVELAESKDKYIRLYSEFDNFRRRTAKEKMELVGTATEKLMTELLPVLDDFERAKLSMDSTQDIVALKEGVDLIYLKFAKVLENKGLKSFASVGEVFNPDFHEAITQIPAPNDDMKGKVLDEVEKGYSLNEKIIRFSKVVIGQ